MNASQVVATVFPISARARGDNDKNMTQDSDKNMKLEKL